MTDTYKSMLPRSGKLVNTAGDIINEADTITEASLADNAIASRAGGVYRAFYYNLALPVGVHNFIINIPVGKKVIGMSRVTTVVNGTVLSEFIECDGATGIVEAEYFGRDFNAPLRQLSQSSLQKIPTLTNPDPVTPPMPIVSPSTGPTRSPSGQSEGGFQPTFDSTRVPAFRYEVLTAPIEFYLQLYYQELEI